jgi:hypothetical protein
MLRISVLSSVELLINPGDNVEVALNDQRDKDYVPPPPPAYVAFSGTGARLGAAGPSAGSGAYVFTSQRLSGVAAPNVDEQAPTTTLQIKTANGKKIKLRQVSCTLLFPVLALTRCLLSHAGLITVRRFCSSPPLLFGTYMLRVCVHRVCGSNGIPPLSMSDCSEGGAADAFALSAGFPPKDVVDGQATIAEAGLLGAAVTQRTV